MAILKGVLTMFARENFLKIYDVSWGSSYNFDLKRFDVAGKTL